MTTPAQMKARAEEHDNKGHSAEMCIRCGWVMGGRPLNCNNDDSPHLFLSQLPELTPEESRAMDASAELARAMRALVGNEEWVSHSDWGEIASRIHDLQARIILHAGSRFGWTRPLGG